MQARTLRQTALQIAFGGLDRFCWVIAPAARDGYRQRGISFGFRQPLRRPLEWAAAG